MRSLVLTLSALLVSFSACVRYRARPLDPSLMESHFRARTLNDEGLRNFILSNYTPGSLSWPPSQYNLDLLTQTAFYYSPDFEVARAGIASADADVLSAGARVNPSLTAEGGYNGNPESGPLYGAAPSFTIETAGKRGLRILQAQKRAEAARISFSETAWRVRTRVRTAFIDHLLSRLKYNQLQNEESIREEIVEIFDARLALGESPRPELDVFRIDLISARAALKTAEGEVARTLAVLATTIGLPAAALNGAKIDSPHLEKPPSLELLPLQSVQRAGLLHRADIRRTLVEYAAAEAALRSEVAAQYPDIQLAPGYSFEEGLARYALSATLMSVPLFHHNQGPIAAAEAHRLQIEAQFNSLQSQVIGEMDAAVIQFSAALAEFNEATSRLAVQRDREEATRKALAAGQVDRLELATVRLQTAAELRARLEALARAQAALGALEDAVQYPLEAGLPLREPPLASPMRKGRAK